MLDAICKTSEPPVMPLAPVNPAPSAQALALPRLGEQENCLLNDHSDSCPFSLSSNAWNLLPRSSIRVIRESTGLLPDDPQDLPPLVAEPGSCNPWRVPATGRTAVETLVPIHFRRENARTIAGQGNAPDYHKSVNIASKTGVSRAPINRR